MRFFAFLVFAAVSASACADIVWPTESKLFAQGRPMIEVLQPTAGGAPDSGAFGDVRNNGYKFHEGIDIRSVRRDRRNEALDDVYFAMDGKVRMINKIAGNSGYGRYVVVEHPKADVEVYTLYAHLAEIDKGVAIGSEVKAGQRVGKMGRSASYPIGKQQAHMHFEIGVRYTDNFEKWYASKKYKEKNFFGNYNGMNLVGFDPYKFYEDARAGKVNGGFADYIKGLPTALVVRVYTRAVPSFVKLYPALVDNKGDSCGWDIHFTWYGMPQKFERVKDPRAGARAGEVEIVKYNPSELNHKCRRMVSFDKKGHPVMTEDLKEMLRKIF